MLTRLTSGKVFVLLGEGVQISTPDIKQLHFETFAGPHPAGLAGTHIHYLDPVDTEKVSWTIGIQDVIAIGHLFTKGKIKTDRVISLGGPSVRDPKHIRTNLEHAYQN